MKQYLLISLFAVVSIVSIIWAIVYGPKTIYNIRNEKYVRETIEQVLYEKGLIE